MALFTGKGDDGTTRTFGCDQRISKSSSTAEALGSLDEVNSFLGLVKVKAAEKEYILSSGKGMAEIVAGLQETLFVVQTEVAGYDMTVQEERVKDLSNIVNETESELPPITTFFVSGGTELAALFDVARTLARRAERRVVGVKDEGSVKVGPYSLAFLNRLSSVLYAFARLANHKAGIKENPPTYDDQKKKV